MSETEKVAAPPAEYIRAAKVTKCESYSISAEGQAMMVFRIDQGPPPGEKFAITLPTTGLKAFRSMLNDLIAAAEKRELSGGMVAIHRPREVTVGNSVHLRGCVALIFNPGAEDETMNLLPDNLGLDVAEAMQKDIYSRMTEAQRRAHITAKSQLLTSGRPTIIIPGRG